MSLGGGCIPLVPPKRSKKIAVLSLAYDIALYNRNFAQLSYRIRKSNLRRARPSLRKISKRLNGEHGPLHRIPKHTPTNLKTIKKLGKHDSPPVQLPSPDASKEEVRLFIHMVLTHEVHQIYKHYPEFIVATVYAWLGNGQDFRNLEKDDFFALCPDMISVPAFAGQMKKRKLFWGKTKVKPFRVQATFKCTEAIGEALWNSFRRLLAAEKKQKNLEDRQRKQDGLQDTADSNQDAPTHRQFEPDSVSHAKATTKRKARVQRVSKCTAFIEKPQNKIDEQAMIAESIRKERFEHLKRAQVVGEQSITRKTRVQRRRYEVKYHSRNYVPEVPTSGSERKVTYAPPRNFAESAIVDAFEECRKFYKDETIVPNPLPPKGSFGRLFNIETSEEGRDITVTYGNNVGLSTFRMWKNVDRDSQSWM
ncbi:hypothetical protein BU16DRAFT_614593 [Lophium mytilinum]|uniref:Uncharacterized protein n=1 Tax=Lophium mytilinum TaxID=390894 RepID=A0A6A6R3B2_9PEZI|nr:hypothetical protein BU16DRAFT_614593 [Lophium mytilinum]